MAAFVSQSRFEALERRFAQVCGAYEQQIALLRAEIDLLREQVARIPQLEAENAALRIENAQLKAQLQSRSVTKNSTNSSVPPSQDPNRDKSKSKNTSLRKKSGKKPGGQKGHEGHHLKMVDHPDHIEEHRVHSCERCGINHEHTHQQVAARYQVIDIPCIAPHVTEHKQMRVQCSCGHLCTAPVDRPSKTPVSYGGNLRNLVSYLSVRQYVPHNRIVELLQSFCGIHISEGTVQNMLVKKDNECLATYKSIKEQIQSATVLGSDETSMIVNGKRHWLWVWQNDWITYLVGATSRGYCTIESLFPSGLPMCIMVSDRLATQLKQIVKLKQVCIPHILRTLVYVHQISNDDWAERMTDLLQRAIRYKKQINYDQLELHEAQISSIGVQLQGLLNESLKQGTHSDHCQTQLRKVDSHMLTFLRHRDVPPDNNGSERAIRTAKVKQKVSTMFKSEKGMHIFARLRSVIDTGIKRGLKPLDVLAQPHLLIAE